MMTPIPRAPEALLDGKTFTFIQYVPILAQILVDAPVSIQFNTSPNGYEYELKQGTSTPFVFGQLWGEALQQFAPLAALYETYTILDVEVQALPSYPGLVYGVTPGIWAIQTAESRTNFVNAFELASQFNATLTKPLDSSGRRLNYQPYLQQNEPSPYLLTFDQSTGGRQLFGVSTTATVTPLITHYQLFTPYFSFSEEPIPIMVYKLKAKVHFRGRQNTIFTPQQISTMYTVKEIGEPIAKLPPVQTVATPKQILGALAARQVKPS